MARRATTPPDDAKAAPEDERREAILVGAEHCFERWGVARTRMEDIAKEAQIARPALYRYFSGKDDLHLAVMVRHIDRVRDELHEQMPAKGKSGPLILNALLRGINASRDRELLSAVLDTEVVHDTARLVGESEAIFEAMSAYWRPYLRHAAQRNELRPGVEIDQAVRWLTLITFYFLSVKEVVPPDQELPAYLRTFVVNALVIE
jgi:AcrR family transcriptional regulator